MTDQVLPRLTNESMPNVLAYSFVTVDSGTKVTLFKSTPGDTTPYMQMHGQATRVVNPERFGSYADKDFRAWCQAFVQAGIEDPA